MEEINYRIAELKDLETLYEFEQGIIKTERPFDETLKAGEINLKLRALSKKINEL